VYTTEDGRRYLMCGRHVLSVAVCFT